MSHLDPKRPATTSELRQFGLLVGGAFAVIALITFWRHKPVLVVGVLGALGATLMLAGLALPALLSRIYVAWMALAVLLSKVTTPVFMGIIYFLVISPLGALMRLAGRNPLKSGSVETKWVSRPPAARQGALERQF